jgi:hypothetical protein
VIVRVDRLNSAGEYEVVADLVADLDDASSYRSVFPIVEDGTYRALAIFHADSDHTGARSEPVTFMVGP